MATAAKVPSGDRESTSSLNDISQLIYVKERELKEIQEMRCLQLEELIANRDALLVESSRRFEKMKEDFQYNLTLLEARDAEILRLETHLEEKMKQLSTSEFDRKTLMTKLEAIEHRDKDRFEKAEQEKVNQKRILQELKEVIESMRWAQAEETKSKAREVESLREELHRLHNSREECLESQRRDLTHTFEQLLHQREETFASKERDIAHQIAVLESRFEQLQTENTRLKAEASDNFRKFEILSEEMSLKEEQCRQLQWRLDDERLSSQSSHDTIHRQLQQLTLDLAVAKEAHKVEATDLQRKLEKANIEVTREREFRIAMEKRSEENRTSTQEDLLRLERQLAELKSKEDAFHLEIAGLREERDDALHRVGALRAEADVNNQRLRNSERELTTLKEEVNSLRARLHDTESELMEEKTTLKLLREEAIDHSRQLEMYAALERERGKEKERDATASASFRQQVEAEISLKFERRLEGADSRIRELENELITLEESKKEALRQLDEEKKEAAAIALRLRLNESQVVSLQQQLNTLKQQDSRKAELRTATSYSPPLHDHHHHGGNNDLYIDTPAPGGGGGASSPIFSEDFGPASVPTSPMGHANDRPDHLMHGYGHGYRRHRMAGMSSYGANESISDLGVSRDLPDDMNSITEKQGQEGGVQSEKTIALQAENERLKGIIREMRMDIEQLQEQVHDKSRLSEGEGGNDKENLQLLQLRLEQTTAEVTRLRGERKRLMEVGNELRAALNRQQQHQPPQQQQLQQLQQRQRHEGSIPTQQILDPSLAWLAGYNNATSSSSFSSSSSPLTSATHRDNSSSSSGGGGSSSSSSSSSSSGNMQEGAVGKLKSQRNRQVLAWTDPEYEGGSHVKGGQGQGKAVSSDDHNRHMRASARPHTSSHSPGPSRERVTRDEGDNVNVNRMSQSSDEGSSSSNSNSNGNSIDGKKHGRQRNKSPVFNEDRDLGQVTTDGHSMKILRGKESLLPLPTSNTERTLDSQTQARQRMVLQRSNHLQRLQGVVVDGSRGRDNSYAPRKVVNYGKMMDDQQQS